MSNILYFISGGFIVLDMVTGIIKALSKKEFTSSIMRQGLFHKCGSILCILFGVLVDYAQTQIDLGITLPIAQGICAYIILMEIGSIIENVCSINPGIMPEKLKSFFLKLKDNENK